MTSSAYSAYGLTISSELPLPELPSAPPGLVADIVVRCGSFPWPQHAAEQGFQIRANEARFFWPECGAYCACSGREIVVDPAPGASPELVRLPLLGTVFAVTLHQRGLFVLHGNAIAIGDAVIALVGEKGRGKSTLAAALYARGHTLVADDVVALDQDSPQALVRPGFPQLKLWPDSAAASLGEDPGQLPRLADGFEKRACRIAARFAAQPLPLRRIYVLEWGDVPGVHQLSPQAMMLQLVTHTYVARFGEEGLHGVDVALHLRRTASLLRQVAAVRLVRPYDLGQLGVLVDLIEEDVAHLICAHHTLG